MSERPERPPITDVTGGTVEYWRAAAQAEAQRTQKLEDWIQSAITFLLALMESDLTSQPWQVDPLEARLHALWMNLADLNLPAARRAEEPTG
jgi:hypothetical protein